MPYVHGMDKLVSNDFSRPSAVVNFKVNNKLLNKLDC